MRRWLRTDCIVDSFFQRWLSCEGLFDRRDGPAGGIDCCECHFDVPALGIEQCEEERVGNSVQGVTRNLHRLSPAARELEPYIMVQVFTAAGFNGTTCSWIRRN